MAVRGVYTPAEEEMLAGWKKNAEGEATWVGEELTEESLYPVMHRIATEDLIIANANGIGDSNPLYRDGKYARNTRWGGIIAPPLYPYVICAPGRIVGFDVPPELGKTGRGTYGPKWEFYKPIRVGDSFKVRDNVAVAVEDITDLDGKGPHKFIVSSGRKFINQDDEVVCINHRRELRAVVPPGEHINLKHDMPNMSEYKYSQEELDYIDKVYDEEEIRGAVPRYWEDVNVGDELQPTASGPVTVWDQILEMAGRGVLVHNTRQVRQKTPRSIIKDKVTGVSHEHGEIHLVKSIAQSIGQPQVHIGRDWTEEALCRLVTNWMGDDGFLSKYDTQQGYMIPMGDTFFCRGRVLGKRVEDNEHLVDIRLWTETMRGYVPSSGMATVRLISRGGD